MPAVDPQKLVGSGRLLTRKDLAQGLQVIKKDESVANATRMAIAAARTALLVLVCGLAMLAMYQTTGFTIREPVNQGEVTLLVQFCGPGAPYLTSSGTNRFGYLSMIGMANRNVLTFVPDPSETERDFELPTLKYYETEEYFASHREHTAGLGLYLFRLNEFALTVGVNKTNATACLNEMAAKAKITADKVANFYGKAVVQALTASGRRTPRAMPTKGPIPFHASLLVWVERGLIWSSSLTTFQTGYTPSVGWRAYWWGFVILTAFLTGVLSLAVARFVFVNWMSAVNAWVAQYDFLWAMPEVRPEEVTGQSARLSAQAQACSTFFLLDNLVGNVVRNEEQWGTALLSTLLHGVVLTLPGVFPLIQCCFFPEYKTLVLVMVGIHFTALLVFGGMYYFNAPSVLRWVPLALHFAATAVCVLYSVAYIIAAVLFLAIRLVVDPQESLGYSVPLGTAIVYGIVLVKRLLDMREHYMSVFQGKVQRGAVLDFLYKMQLDIPGIIVTTIVGVAVILSLTTLLMLASAMCVTANSLSGYMFSFITPMATFFMTVLQLQGTKTAADFQSKKILNDPIYVIV